RRSVPATAPYPPNARLAASSRRWHRHRRGVARTTGAGSIDYGRWYGQGGPTKRGRSGGDWTSRAALPNPRLPVHRRPNKALRTVSLQAWLKRRVANSEAGSPDRSPAVQGRATPPLQRLRACWRARATVLGPPG